MIKKDGYLGLIKTKVLETGGGNGNGGDGILPLILNGIPSLVVSETTPLVAAVSDNESCAKVDILGIDIESGNLDTVIIYYKRSGLEDDLSPSKYIVLAEKTNVEEKPM